MKALLYSGLFAALNQSTMKEANTICAVRNRGGKNDAPFLTTRAGREQPRLRIRTRDGHHSPVIVKASCDIVESC